LLVQAAVALARAAQSLGPQQPVGAMQPTPAQYFVSGAPQTQTWLPLHVAVPLQVVQQPLAGKQPTPAQCCSPLPQTQVPSVQVLPAPQSLSWQHSVPVTQPLGPTAQ
jgi:hypothetical protein